MSQRQMLLDKNLFSKSYMRAVDKNLFAITPAKFIRELRRAIRRGATEEQQLKWLNMSKMSMALVEIQNFIVKKELQKKKKIGISVLTGKQ